MTHLVARTELLEREAEIVQIGGGLDAAAAGAGGVIVIEGAAGIGKSTLMDEAAALAEERGMVVLRARGSIMEREFAFGVVIQLLAQSIELLGAQVREELFAGAAGLARPLFEDVPDRAPSDERLFARFHGLHWLCVRLAEALPLALLVDDAHWADEPSLRFLAYLEARLEELPACAILAVRTGEPAPEPLSGVVGREPRPRSGRRRSARRPLRRSSAQASATTWATKSAPPAPRPRPATRCSPVSSSPHWGSAVSSRRASAAVRSLPWARRRWPASCPRGCGTGRRRWRRSRERSRSWATMRRSPISPRSRTSTATRRRARSTS